MVPRPSSGPNNGPTSSTAVRVYNVKAGDAVQVLALSPMYGGCFTHYVKKRTRYCSGDACRREWHGTERYWRGYFAANRWDQTVKLWIPCVFELTEHAELDLRSFYARGQVWQFERDEERHGKHMPVRAELRGHLDAAHVPEAWDYRPVLLHLFHERAVAMDVENPLPPRLVLPTIKHDPAIKLLTSNEEAAASDYPYNRGKWSAINANGSAPPAK